MLTCLPPTTPIRTTEPTLLQEPVTLAEARRQCNLAESNDYHDPDLIGWIPAARREVEKQTGIVFYTGEHKWYLTEFPDRDWVEFQIKPVTAIGSITYVDTAGTTQVWSNSNYSLDDKSYVHSVQLAYSTVWPTVRGDTNGITITFTAGYASVLAMPPELKAAVKMKIREMWLLKQGEDHEDEVRAYDRQMNLVRRDIYA